MFDKRNIRIYYLKTLERIRSFLLSRNSTAWVLVRYKTKASKIIFLIFAGSMLIPFQQGDFLC